MGVRLSLRVEVIVLRDGREENLGTREILLSEDDGWPAQYPHEGEFIFRVKKEVAVEVKGIGVFRLERDFITDQEIIYVEPLER